MDLEDSKIVKGHSSALLLANIAVWSIVSLGGFALFVLTFTYIDDWPSHPSEHSPSGADLSFLLPYPAITASLTAGFIGILGASIYAYWVIRQPIGTSRMAEIQADISEGSKAFLNTEYMYLSVFVLLVFLLAGIGAGPSVTDSEGWYIGICFLVGAIFSATAGYIGMQIATAGNARTAFASWKGLSDGLTVAFRSGAVMGLCIVSFSVIGLASLFLIFNASLPLAGFAAGASSVALFARVGGGIYTKAADVGADLVGKVEADIPEDDPRNPATIADNVGDNVGDVAGMGSDLFESICGSIVSCIILGARQETYPFNDFANLGYGTIDRSMAVGMPFWIMMIGIVSAVVGTAALRCNEKMSLTQLLSSMRMNVMLSAFSVCLGTLVTVLVAQYSYNLISQIETSILIWTCVTLGLISGIAIGWITEYFTSNEEAPTKSIAQAAEFGAGPVVIQGLGMGMLSATIPMIIIVATVVATYKCCGFYGTALAAVGMLSTLGVTMATDAYGPIADNAGGIAEMAELPHEVRERTDRLDALGNTTAATGKGFANGSAILASITMLASFAFAVTADKLVDITSSSDVPFNAYLINEYTLAGLFIGALLPFVFSAFTLLAVSRAAQAMIVEVRRQFLEIPGLREGLPGVKAEHKKCVAIATQSSLREMIFPSIIAILTPLAVGLLMGYNALVGLLMGAVATGYLLGVTMNNAGGAWDNAKKAVEAGTLKDRDGVVMGKGSEWHKAAISGDTVGDPCKDTSGPALNILITLMTAFVLTFVRLFQNEENLDRTYYHGIWVTALLLFCTVFFMWLNNRVGLFICAFNMFIRLLFVFNIYL
eukprot:GHVL01018862.1.p1 GENE.GHVL01018862.1~~GHVL01018862.1.p1  ORF type:complete len:829 (-),score=138.43 GHVL01018862.1:23-2509(-)